jgi:hypothetical protein
MRLLFSLFLIVHSVSLLYAQGFQMVFPGLSGPELIDSVASRYRPLTVLDYANARDTLYAKVLAVDDDSIRCVYTGHTLYLDPMQDPTQYIFQGGGTNGMNTEHAYPQAKGAADGNARSDMHHIYPTRIAVNEARANSPYLEIADQQTQKWFIRNQVFTSIPASEIDAYSEQRTDAFEPRESVKGDLARSVFYFYTMYRAQANLADPIFFELQRTTLCQWAQQDPADSVELRKTWRIAPYQEGKPNPFVVDCTLASRCWCPEYPPNCLVSVLNPDSAPFRLNIWPNPVRDQLYFSTTDGTSVSVRLFDLMGKIMVPAQGPATDGALLVSSLPPGLYWLEATQSAGYKTFYPVLVQ